ncbi:unnamed protein product [Euphydryas editha]|uniref:Uncharacterized protein n=1 Tax=Euphydryas editha TaxID=104508 RepID=A0AAU9URM5_EUPED|nr:unnamed protein product [Euphydryas editha]CAH2101828.1 unnamed protein product [Euphydryas editha]
MQKEVVRFKGIDKSNRTVHSVTRVIEGLRGRSAVHGATGVNVALIADWSVASAGTLLALVKDQSAQVKSTLETNLSSFVGLMYLRSSTNNGGPCFGYNAVNLFCVDGIAIVFRRCVVISKRIIHTK